MNSEIVPPEEIKRNLITTDELEDGRVTFYLEGITIVMYGASKTDDEGNVYDAMTN